MTSGPLIIGARGDAEFRKTPSHSLGARGLPRQGQGNRIWKFWILGGTIAKASSPSRAASRPPQDEEAFLTLGLILRCERSEPRRIEAKPEPAAALSVK